MERLCCGLGGRSSIIIIIVILRLAYAISDICGVLDSREMKFSTPSGMRTMRFIVVRANYLHLLQVDATTYWLSVRTFK